VAVAAERIADMVINLTSLGAAVIAFDIVFSEPDRLNSDIAADTIRYLDEATRAKLRALPTNDQILAEPIRRSRVVLGESGLPGVLTEFDESLPLTGLAMLGEEPQRFLFDFPGLLRNVRVLEQAAAGRGLFTIKAERDGIVRRVPMLLRAQGATVPSLSLEMLRVATATGTILVKSEKAGVKSIAVRGLEVPTDGNGQLWVHFARQDPSIYVSAVEVLDGSVAPEKIRGKLVLIGTSAVGLNDIKTTPVSGCGDSCAGARERADPCCDAFAADLRHRRRTLRRYPARTSGDRVCSAVRAGQPRCRRRAVRIAAGRNLLVFLLAASAVD
jgi:adenylate cyclase